ncbi:MAG TPA: DNA polymerase I, partial [Alphaproteobacteria bacterium]|nr:DNA polymerase I [Alphaproteobacteria bacterium]
MTRAQRPVSSFKPRHVYLVDGSGFLFRAFFALAPMTRPDGTPVNAVYGFTRMMMKLLADADADCVAVIFDSARKTFRNSIYPQYKAQRPEPPDELVPQFALVREAARALNLPAIEQPGFEADDLIATYARLAEKQGAKVTIVSSDKDLMQLVRPGVEMLDPIKQRPIGPADVMEKFGVGPEKVVDVQALAGDSTDNVPGVPGIGVKTAAQLINEYGDLDTLLKRAGEIKQPKRREALLGNADLARTSRALVKLKDDVPLDVPLDALTVHEPDPAKLIAFLKDQAFRSILAQVEGRGAPTSASAKANHAADAIAANAESKHAKHEPAPASHPAHPAPHKGHAQAGGKLSGAKFSGTKSYELVQSMEALEAWIAEATEAGIVAVDTETTSLDATRAELVGVSLSVEPGRACYIPLGHTAPQRQATLDLGDGAAAKSTGKAGALVPGQLKLDAALKALKPMLADPSVLKIGHNIKYDMVVLAHYGVAIEPIDDTMLISYVLEAGLHGHGMDELAELHLGHKTIHYEDVTGRGKAQIGFAEVALDKACDYAAEDADVTRRLHAALKPRLAPEHVTTVYETIERPLVPVIARMEQAGIKVELAELERLSKDFAKRLAELEKQIHKLAGEEFNVGSPKQLGEILFDKMSLEGGRKGKTGAYSTDADVLEDLAAQGHDLPARVLDWRQLQKLKSTYADALMEQIDPKTGRVHTAYGMAIASTGRLSSTDPNLQNIPVRTEEGRRIRRAFVAEKGMRLVSLDYSQIELRLLAHVARIETLRQAFRDGADIHAITASQVFGVPAKGMDPMIRRKAKAINFGIIYGISPFGLGRQLGIPQSEAAAYIKAYFERYPGIRDYMEATKELARKQGFVTTIFGRKIHTPEIRNANPARRNFAERAAINAPLQGGAADIIKRAMIRVEPALEHAKLGARMLLQVHDELLFEVKTAEVEKTIEVVKAVMESAAHLDVPLTVDSGVAENWA